MSDRNVVTANPCLCGINPGEDCDRSCEVVREPTLDDLYRVYHREWVLVYSSAATGDEGTTEVVKHFEEKYQGRIRDADWQPLLLGPHQASELTLHLPVLKGEFKKLAHATHLAMTFDVAHTEVVIRNSKEERALLDYGKRKLPSDQ